jgi:hypothetical protein
MIILNLWAFSVLAIIAAAGWLLDVWFPTLFQPAYKLLTLGSIVFLVGAITEMLRIRGRIFFTPIWLLGLILIAVAAYEQWGVMGAIIPSVAVVLAVVFLFSSRTERNEPSRA